MDPNFVNKMFAIGIMIFMVVSPLCLGIYALIDNRKTKKRRVQRDKLRKEINDMFTGSCSTPQGLAENADKLVELIDEWHVLTSGQINPCLHMSIKLFQAEWRKAEITKEFGKLVSTFDKFTKIKLTA